MSVLTFSSHRSVRFERTLLQTTMAASGLEEGPIATVTAPTLIMCLPAPPSTSQVSDKQKQTSTYIIIILLKHYRVNNTLQDSNCRWCQNSISQWLLWYCDCLLLCVCSVQDRRTTWLSALLTSAAASLPAALVRNSAPLLLIHWIFTASTLCRPDSLTGGSSGQNVFKHLN